MFGEKGFSKEQTDLFLKKVNFMENREYFFHKRKAMAVVGQEDETGAEQQRQPRRQRQQHWKEGKENKKVEFFDKISSSCGGVQARSDSGNRVQY